MSGRPRRVAGGGHRGGPQGEVVDDCGGGAEETIDVVLAGAGRRRPFFSAVRAPRLRG